MQPLHKSGGKEVHLHGTFTCRSSAQISEKWINYKRTAISNKSKKKEKQETEKMLKTAFDISCNNYANSPIYKLHSKAIRVKTSMLKTE